MLDGSHKKSVCPFSLTLACLHCLSVCKCSDTASSNSTLAVIPHIKHFLLLFYQIERDKSSVLHNKLNLFLPSGKSAHEEFRVLYYHAQMPFLQVQVTADSNEKTVEKGLAQEKPQQHGGRKRGMAPRRMNEQNGRDGWSGCQRCFRAPGICSSLPRCSQEGLWEICRRYVKYPDRGRRTPLPG